MKRIIKELLPPFIIKMVRKIVFTKTEKFDNYEDVVKYSRGDYNNKELTEVVSIKTKNYIKNLYKKEVQLGQEEQKLLNIFCLNDKKSLNVLDVGGGSGIHFHIVKSQLGVQLNWIVLETPEMVKSNLNNTHQELNFVDDVSKIRNLNFDLIFLSGVIQYVPYPYNFLKQILSLNSKKIIITRTPFKNSGKEFFTIQKSLLSENGPGELPKKYKDKFVKYPRYSFTLNDFKEFLDSQKIKYIPVYDGKGIIGRDEVFSMTFYLK